MCPGFGRAASGDKVQPIETTYINRHPTHTQTANTPHTQHTHRREYELSPSLHMSSPNRNLRPRLRRSPQSVLLALLCTTLHLVSCNMWVERSGGAFFLSGCSPWSRRAVDCAPHQRRHSVRKGKRTKKTKPDMVSNPRQAGRKAGSYHLSVSAH